MTPNDAEFRFRLKIHNTNTLFAPAVHCRRGGNEEERSVVYSGHVKPQRKNLEEEEEDYLRLSSAGVHLCLACHFSFLSPATLEPPHE